MWIRESQGGFEEVARRFGTQGKGELDDGQKRMIEEDAGKGIYQEDGSIMQ